MSRIDVPGRKTASGKEFENRAGFGKWVRKRPKACTVAHNIGNSNQTFINSLYVGKRFRFNKMWLDSKPVNLYLKSSGVFRGRGVKRRGVTQKMPAKCGKQKTSE